MQTTPQASNVLSFAGAAITTAFQLSPAIPSGNGTKKIRLITSATTITGTAMTKATIETFGSGDGITFFPIASTNDTDPSDVAPSHDFTLTTPAPSTTQGSCVIDGTYAFYKVGVKVQGGAGQAGETLSVSARSVF